MKNKKIIRNTLFTPFSISRWFIIFLAGFGIFLSFLLYFRNDLNTQHLRDMSEMVINIQFILAALIISVVSIRKESKKNENRDQDLIFKYIGSILVAASIGVLGYVLSYILDITYFSSLIKLYCVCMIICVNGSIINSLKYIMEIFQIK